MGRQRTAAAWREQANRQLPTRHCSKNAPQFLLAIVCSLPQTFFMSEAIQNSGPSFGIVSRIISELEPLPPAERQHVLNTVATWFKVGVAPTNAARNVQQVTPASQDEKFSNRPVLSVKDFIFEKEPATEPERMACLAYYLTHYKDMPHFKTVDLTRLNTEAAQRTFSNPAVASNNASRDGFFVSAPK